MLCAERRQKFSRSPEDEVSTPFSTKLSVSVTTLPMRSRAMPDVNSNRPARQTGINNAATRNRAGSSHQTIRVNSAAAITQPVRPGKK